MTKVEILKQIGIIGDIRQRLGAKDENDTQMDIRINVYSTDQLVKAWAGWQLGDGSWWTTMKSYYDKIEELDKNE